MSNPFKTVRAMLNAKREELEAEAERWAKSFSGECRQFCKHTAEDHSGARWHLACAYLDAITELRDRRSRDLTDEDREALAFARDRVSFSLNSSAASEFYSDGYIDQHECALAVLSKLLTPPSTPQKEQK